MNKLKLEVLKKIMKEMDEGVSENALKPKAAIIKEKMIIMPKKKMGMMDEEESPDLERGEEKESEEHPTLPEEMVEQIALDHLKEDPNAYPEEESEEESEEEPEEDLGFSVPALKELMLKKKKF